MLYLAISEGVCADDAVPIFATTDPAIIRQVGELIVGRLGGRTSRVRALTRQTGPSESDE